ncbi:MAG TPA: FAD-dependent monooxygenase [Rhodoblastus sp.]|nr:FAD-dependent monooxygenase [Rhodoblastus sp.]
MTPDRAFDVVIVGGAAAGVAVACALAASGVEAAIVDLHETFPPDFKADKVAGDQIGLMRRLGLFDALTEASARSDHIVNMRRGRVIDRATTCEYNLPYEDLVNAMRRRIPASITRIVGKVARIEASDDRQRVELSNGDILNARLVILATGGGEALRASLGYTRRVLRKDHSVSVAFDLRPVGRDKFDFETLTVYGDAPRDGIDYISIFPFPTGTRANLFLYRGVKDPIFAAFRADPKQALLAALPGIDRAIGPFETIGKALARPVDLYEVDGVDRPGVVLIGDAFRTSCPAVGDGLSRAFTDAERLGSVYVPQWLATPGMGASKIAAFYRDPEKLACDGRASHAANYRRNSTVGHGMGWELHRRRVILQRRVRAMIGALAPRRATAG